MRQHETDDYAALLETARADQVEAVTRALRGSGIPFQSGLAAGDVPRVVFHVPRTMLAEARDAVARRLAVAGEAEEEKEEEEAAVSGRATFPWAALTAAATLVLAHLALVFWIWSPLPPGRELLQQGSLLRGAVREQPWRLLTSLFLHASPSHALWNGVSMTVFAVPLIVDLGLARVAALYLLAGLGGALTALAFADAGVHIVGSSGAVAGLFGAWVVLRLRSAQLAALAWRTRVRALGIALLVLPSLISPTGAAGQSISVSSHLGGMASGMAIGAALSVGWLARREAATAWSPD